MRAILAPLLLVATAAAAEPPPDLTPGEIRAEILEAPLAWWETDGWRHGRLHLSADGAARIVVDGPGAATDAGRWRLDGRRLCTAWTALRDGAERCYTLRRAGDGRFATSGGNMFEIIAPDV